MSVAPIIVGRGTAAGKSAGMGLHPGLGKLLRLLCLSEVLVLFRYPVNSGNALQESVLPLRYCATRFASRVPTWPLPRWGHVADPVTEGGEEVGIVHVAPCPDIVADVDVGTGGAGGNWAGGLQGFGRESDCAGKLQQKDLLWVCNLVPCVWKRLRVGGHHSRVDVEAKRRCLHQHDEGMPVYDRAGTG